MDLKARLALLSSTKDDILDTVAGARDLFVGVDTLTNTSEALRAGPELVPRLTVTHLQVHYTEWPP